MSVSHGPTMGPKDFLLLLAMTLAFSFVCWIVGG